MLHEAERRLAAFVSDVAAAEGVTVAARSLARFEPVEFDPRIVDLLEDLVDEDGRTHVRLPSGAGHDAQMMARLCPTGMLFVPSRDGISHNPAEHTDPEHLVAGTNLLLRAMLRLAAVPLLSKG